MLPEILHPGKKIYAVAYLMFTSHPAYRDSFKMEFIEDSITIHSYYPRGFATSITYIKDSFLLPIKKMECTNWYFSHMMKVATPTPPTIMWSSK
jgi:hypothetical protein